MGANMIQGRCPRCGRGIVFPAQYAGKSCQCTVCGAVFRIQVAAPPPPASFPAPPVKAESLSPRDSGAPPRVSKPSLVRQFMIVGLILVFFGAVAAAVVFYLFPIFGTSDSQAKEQKRQERLVAEVQETIAAARTLRDEGKVDEARGMLLGKLVTVGAFDDERARRALHEELNTYPRVPPPVGPPRTFERTPTPPAPPIRPTHRQRPNH